ncbi:MAG: ThiF family adenylyltransferase [Spirochaetales bacterium]
MGFEERTKLVLGDEAIEKLKNAKVIVFGVGGVGGYVCEMLTRTGVGSLTIVDFDTVSVSNLNRQIIALTSTLGKKKVEVMQNRLKDINPSLNLLALDKKFSAETKEFFKLQNYDYVVDAIDILDNKIDLIAYAKELNVKIISAMGAGNRGGIPHFEVVDIFKTSYDSLAKKVRKLLKDRGVNNLTVVYTKEPPQKLKPVGSVVYYPAMCGTVLAAKVINNIISG